MLEKKETLITLWSSWQVRRAAHLVIDRISTLRRWVSTEIAFNYTSCGNSRFLQVERWSHGNEQSTTRTRSNTQRSRANIQRSHAFILRRFTPLKTLMSACSFIQQHDSDDVSFQKVMFTSGLTLAEYYFSRTGNFWCPTWQHARSL